MTQTTSVLSPAVPVPAHVPLDLVHDFDYVFDPELSYEPHGRYERLLAETPPVFWTPRGGGHWMLNRAEFVFEAVRDWESFFSEHSPPPAVQAMLAQAAEGSRVPKLTPIGIDPPAHAKFRALLNRAFSPVAVTKLQNDIRAHARELIDRVEQQGGSEAINALAVPLPVQAFLNLMGLPTEHLEEYRALICKMMATPGGDPVASAKLLQEMADCMRDTIVARRNAPRDDFISRLWATDIEGTPLTLELMEEYAVLLFFAGLDTVTNAIGFGLRHLATDPELQRRLRAEPACIPAAVEEFLRRYPTVVGMRRVAKDLAFHGVEMKADERVALSYVVCNLDPQRWGDATRVDIEREAQSHIAFSTGPHRCPGSHLARLELRIVFEEVLARLPEFRLDPERPATFRGGMVIGIDTLDLLWDA